MPSINKQIKNSDIARRIKALRGSKKRAAQAKCFGIDQGAYSRLEKGQALPSAKTLQALARKGININWLLTGEGEASLELSRVAEVAAACGPQEMVFQLPCSLEISADDNQIIIRVRRGERGER